MEGQEEKVREKAYTLCKEYLQGKWKQLKMHQLCIRQISGGLSNIVFYVGMPEGMEPEGREPASILLRLFGELGTGPQQQFRLITETVVFTMLAERNLGPKLHGVFPGGRLEEFIPGHPLTSTELRSPVYSEQIAKNFALIHSLEIPVSKEPSWLGDTLRSLVAKNSPVVPERVARAEKEAATYLATWDLSHEVDWLLSFLKNVKSPVVFSHNDLNCGNILVREENKDWDPIVFIDYEFAAYNHRGFDIANHFVEWSYDYATKDFPYFQKDGSKYPSRDQMARWVRKYLETYMEQQALQQENNLCPRMRQSAQLPITEQIEEVLREVKAYSLASHLLWACWAIKQGQQSNIKFSYFSYAADRLTDYNKEKAEVLDMLESKRPAAGAVKRRRLTEEMSAAVKKTSQLNGNNGNHEL